MFLVVLAGALNKTGATVGVHKGKNGIAPTIDHLYITGDFFFAIGVMAFKYFGGVKHGGGFKVAKGFLIARLFGFNVGAHLFCYHA